MTLIDKTAASQFESVTLEFELRHAPQKVWRCLTDPVLLSEWLLPIVELKLERGAAFRFTAPAMPGWDGIVNGEMIEAVAPEKLSYRWVVGEIDTIVTFTLTPTSSGTHLSLVQSGFKPHQKQNFGGARYGLKMMGEKLIALLDRTNDKEIV